METRQKARTLVRRFAVLLVSALLLASCSSPPPAASAPASSSAAPDAVSPAPLHMLSASGLGPQGLSTGQGYYELANTGEGCYNILYTDFSTKNRVFLCNRPECTHRDETCTSYLSRGGFLFPLEGKIGLFLFGTTLIDAPDEERRSRVYSMNYDGSSRKELFAMDPSVTVFSGMATDGRFFYFIATILGDDWADQSMELVRMDLQNGKVESLKKFGADVPFLGGVTGDSLVFEYGAQTEDGFVYRCSVFSLSTGSEQVFYESPQEVMVRGDQVLCWDKAGQMLTAVSAADGTVRQWPISLNVADDTVITLNASEVQIDDFIVFDLYEAGRQTQVLFDPQTGKFSPVTLTYAWIDGIQRPIYVLAQADDHLLVVNGSAIADIQYQKMDGTLETRQTVRTFYAFLSREDYLAGRPSYIPVQDMLDDLFVS